jgi:hypothetical protein
MKKPGTKITKAKGRGLASRLRHRLANPILKPGRKPHFSEEESVQIAEAYLSGVPVTELGRIHDVPIRLIYRTLKRLSTDKS